MLIKTKINISIFSKYLIILLWTFYFLLFTFAPAYSQNIIGDIEPPEWLEKHGSMEIGGTGGFGLINFFNNLLKLLTVVAGLWSLVNLLFAGLGFVSSGGDTEKINNAQKKIWSSLYGLILIAASYTLAAIIGWLLFGNATMIINPEIYGPGA